MLEIELLSALGRLYNSEDATAVKTKIVLEAIVPRSEFDEQGVIEVSVSS